MLIKDFTNQLNVVRTGQEQERVGYEDRITRLQESLREAEKKIEDLDGRLQAAEYWVDYYWWCSVLKKPDPQYIFYLPGRFLLDKQIIRRCEKLFVSQPSEVAARAEVVRGRSWSTGMVS